MLKHSLGKGNGAYLMKNQACAVSEDREQVLYTGYAMPQGAILQDVPIQYATDMKGFLDLEYATDMKGLLVLQRLGPKRRANKPEPQVMKPIACFVLSHLKSRDVPWCPSCLVSRDVPRCVPPGVPPGVRPGVPWCPVVSLVVPWWV